MKSSLTRFWSVVEGKGDTWRIHRGGDCKCAAATFPSHRERGRERERESGGGGGAFSGIIHLLNLFI